MNLYPRTTEKYICDWLFKGKIIILYGARQVGKTTLSKHILEKHPEKSLYINCELQKNRDFLTTGKLEDFKLLIGDHTLIALDEAQTIENIGFLLKQIVDTYPEIQVIATGSSSFDLANTINEPLTGRAIPFMLYPMGITELLEVHPIADFHGKLEHYLIYGLYPDLLNKSQTEIETILPSIANNYLYKDILNYEQIKKPKLLEDLLKLLALQVGSEVSLLELSRTLGTSGHTIERYLDLLEKIFVVRRLHSFSRNLRNEIRKSIKVYFYDLGIRNHIINNFNPLSLRNDKGALWENFCIMERIKHNHNQLIYPNFYFWRTYTQKEIDLIEERNGHIIAYEFKYSANQRIKKPQEFLTSYPDSEFKCVTSSEYIKHLTVTQTSPKK